MHAVLFKEKESLPIRYAGSVFIQISQIRETRPFLIMAERQLSGGFPSR